MKRLRHHILLGIVIGAFSSIVHASSLSWINYIKAGHPVKLVFDQTSDKFDDSQYTGNWRTDPMGTIKGNKTYTCTYKKGRYACTGYNQGARKVGTWTYSNAKPFDSQISLWGRVFVFDGKANLYDPEYGLVGRISR